MDTQLYKRLCLFVGRLVGWSVVPLVCWSVEVIEWKSDVFDTYCVGLSLGGGLGCGWGLDTPAHPSATIF